MDGVNEVVGETDGFWEPLGFSLCALEGAGVGSMDSVGPALLEGASDATKEGLFESEGTKETVGIVEGGELPVGPIDGVAVGSTVGRKLIDGGKLPVGVTEGTGEGAADG